MHRRPNAGAVHEIGSRIPPVPEDVLRVLQSKAETRAFYDKISAVYDLLAERSEAPVRRRGLQIFSAQPRERVLEIGFGTGHSLIDLVTAVGATGQVVGVDLSLGMAECARRRVDQAALRDRVHIV